METVNGLPEFCFGVIPTSKVVILIKRGETGYYPFFEGTQVGQDIADRANERLGITKAQAAAMSFGSLFGWNIPAANPENYNEDGTLK